MAQQTRTQIKDWFRTGLKPLQQQFWDWIDSFWHKSDSIPQASITGLQDALPTSEQLQQLVDLRPKEVIVNTSGTFEIPSGRLLQNLVFITTSDNNVKAGFSANSGEIFDDLVVNLEPSVVDFSFYTQTGETIFFTGNCTVQIYLR